MPGCTVRLRYAYFVHSQVALPFDRFSHHPGSGDPTKNHYHMLVQLRDPPIQISDEPLHIFQAHQVPLYKHCIDYLRKQL